jgi:hypothetical protein
MHIVTYKHTGVHHRCTFFSLSSTINFIVSLRDRNITFTHIFEE